MLRVGWDIWTKPCLPWAHGPFVLWILCALVTAAGGCYGTRSGPSHPRAAVDNTFASLNAHHAEWGASALVHPESGAQTQLNADEHRIARRAVRRCKPAVGWTMTPPPWETLLVFEARDGKQWFAQLTVSSLRMDNAHPRRPSLTSIHGNSPTVADCTLHDDDQVALTNLFARHLGPPQSRSQRQAMPTTSAPPP